MSRTLILLVLSVILLGVIPAWVARTPTQTRIVQLPIEIVPEVPAPPPKVSYAAVVMKIPAVDEEGRGVMTLLEVVTRPGRGRTLVNIDQLLFWVDTQHSIRVARNVAQNVTGADLTAIDLIYTIETNASVIGGESAGAAITVATIAALTNASINPTVMITGTIDSAGQIGQVGAVLAKAMAVKEAGAHLFLVPTGQARQVYYQPVRHCEQIGPFTYCTTEYRAEQIDIAQQVGIEVIEVATISETLKYFLT